SGHFPYYRDAQYPPMYQHPAASALDLAQHRLAAGERDFDHEREMSRFLELTWLEIPGYAESTRQEEKLEAVHGLVIRIMDAMNVEREGYRQAASWPERSQALLHWLTEQEGHLLKPMNCPHHIQIYKAEPRSYRDLPVRLAEFGTVYRYEQTGELSGMTRV